VTTATERRALTTPHGSLTDLHRVLGRHAAPPADGARGDFDDLHGRVTEPAVPDLLGASGIRAAFDEFDRQQAARVGRARAENVDRCAAALARACEPLRPVPVAVPAAASPPPDPLDAIRDDATATLERWGAHPAQTT
jgi:hypothetical protein